jgi:hypothetical protein
MGHGGVPGLTLPNNPRIFKLQLPNPQTGLVSAEFILDRRPNFIFKKTRVETMRFPSWWCITLTLEGFS